MKREILTLDEIRLLVHTFYEAVRQDKLLAPIFDSVIQDAWPVHLEKMIHFWQTILLNDHTYFGSPFPPHARLPLEKVHFDRWLMLFEATIDANFLGEKADEAKWRARKMAEMFLMKIEYFQNKPNALS